MGLGFSFSFFLNPEFTDGSWGQISRLQNIYSPHPDHFLFENVCPEISLHEIWSLQLFYYILTTLRFICCHSGFWVCYSSPIPTLCLNNLLNVPCPTSLGLSGFFFLVPFAWESEAFFSPSCLTWLSPAWDPFVRHHSKLSPYCMLRYPFTYNMHQQN